MLAQDRVVEGFVRDPSSRLPVSSVSLCQFSLTREAPLRQLTLEAANPFCELAAAMPEGAAVCNQGCGMEASHCRDMHFCPFGMLMRRLPNQGDGAVIRWIGRRFTSVAAMHDALDRLRKAGVDDDTILNHLPPNPVLSEKELSLQASAHEASRLAPPTPEEHKRLTNVLEYLTQLHSLIVTADRPDQVCERFLRALCGVLPFDEMSVYLRQCEADDLVIAAAVDHEQLRRDHPHAHPCRLEPESVGSLCLEQGKILIQSEHGIEPVHGEMAEPGLLAIPLKWPLGEGGGVWLARRGATAHPSPLGSEPIRLMRLLAGLLAERIGYVATLSARQEVQAAEPQDVVEAKPQPWDGLALDRHLEAELARVTRFGSPAPALLKIQIGMTKQEVILPLAELAGQLGQALRPFDQLGQSLETPEAWYAILPQTGEEGARQVAVRLTGVIEDMMDLRGGTEELGLRIVVGLSVWGIDATRVGQMVHNVSTAVDRALASPVEPVVQMFKPLDSAMSV